MLYAGQLLADLSVNTQCPVSTVDATLIYPVGSIKSEGCQVSGSLDGKHFRRITGKTHRNARYIRAVLSPGSQTGRARVLVGSGFVATPSEAFTEALAQRKPGFAWRGADGIYSVVTHTDALDSGRMAVITFGDTLISGIGRGGRRTQPVVMVNNSFATLKGMDPEAEGALTFHVPLDASGKPHSLLTPQASAFAFAQAGVACEDTYYWMQDMAVLGDKLITWPLLITSDPTGPEGMQFRVLGTAMAQIPLTDGMPDYAHAQQFALNLHHKEAGREILYGCAALRMPEGHLYEGYFYLYGYLTIPGGRYLCVSRVKPEDIADRDAWRFFDGSGFVADIRQSAPLCKDVSAELSVSLLQDGPERGKYLLVYQHQTNKPYVGYALGETPTGPFGKGHIVWHCPEVGDNPQVYTYNAKAHPAFSAPGRVLVSYNVNSYRWQDLMDDALLCRPRFLWLRHTAEDGWANMFAQAMQGRLSLFRWMNPRAQQGGTVFAGDSLVQECPIAELAAGQPYYNRGIGGDTARSLRHHLRDSILSLAPRQAVILCGTNDLAEAAKPEEVAGNLVGIAQAIRAALPQCRVLILAIPPVYDGLHPTMDRLAVGARTNHAIRAVNELVRAQAEGAGFLYVDIHTPLAGSDGCIRPAYTREGLHLSAEGYQRVMDVVVPLLQMR